MRWIYLSPHLDDAVFSAGGLIYEQRRAGIPVEIWTFMCGAAREADVSPFAQALHTMWGFGSAAEAIHMRREEDRRAASSLDASTVYFDFLDCIYRRGANGEWLYSEVFVPPHPEDADIPPRIAETISERLQPDDVLVCQLGLGSHADHTLVRQGAELLGWSLRYDIDVPYIFMKPEELGPKSAGMQESVLPISETGLERWQAASLEYRSQIPGLGEAFDTPEKVQDSLRRYWAERNGILILQKS